MRALQQLLIGAVVVVVASANANADRRRQVRYVGLHPVPKAEGGGTCQIEGRHVHVYAADKLQYRDHRGDQFFVGDPVAYGYTGPKYAYKGHHPIRVDLVIGDEDRDVEYCYLDGPHYHAFAPPRGPDFTMVGGAYFYVGTPDKAYVQARPAMVQINATYRPIVYERPVVTVAAPVGWIGLRVDVVAPAVVVSAPAVIIHDHRRFKYKKMKHKKWKH
jgi:hypothetical protein